MAIEMAGVTVIIDGRTILDDIAWRVADGERWVVLGPNGSGKTTLLQLASAVRFPTRGRVAVLGGQLGRTDMRQLRERIGHASARLASSLRPTITASDVVVSGVHGALETWWHEYSDDDWRRARKLLEDAALSGFEERAFVTLSEGEKQRVLVARAFMGHAELVTLDEPAAGLDLRNRELLVHQLSALAADSASPPMVLITHHVEEIPAGFTHLLLLQNGRIVASGPLEDTLTADALSTTFATDLVLERRNNRFFAFSSSSFSRE